MPSLMQASVYKRVPFLLFWFRLHFKPNQQHSRPGFYHGNQSYRLQRRRLISSPRHIRQTRGAVRDGDQGAPVPCSKNSFGY